MCLAVTAIGGFMQAGFVHLVTSRIVEDRALRVVSSLSEELAPVDTFSTYAPSLEALLGELDLDLGAECCFQVPHQRETDPQREDKARCSSSPPLPGFEKVGHNHSRASARRITLYHPILD